MRVHYLNERRTGGELFAAEEQRAETRFRFRTRSCRLRSILSNMRKIVGVTVLRNTSEGGMCGMLKMTHVLERGGILYYVWA